MNTTTAPPILDHLSALGDETRTRILVLLERSEFTVSEICLALQLPQPTVSRHLRTLLEDGWLEARTEGRNRHYRFADGLGDELRNLWSVVRAGLESFQVYRRDGERARQVLAERKRQASAFFAASADRWDELRRELFGPRAEYLPLLGFLDPRWVVGDLGAGTGGLAATIAPFVRKVIGIDRSEAMLATARELLAGRENVELRPGELESLPLKDGELDLAVLSLVLHYVVDPREALAEAHRVLKPGGRLLVVEMRAHDRGPRYAREMGHVWPGFQPDELTGWVRGAGFDHVVTRPLPPDPEALGPPLFLSAALRP